MTLLKCELFLSLTLLFGVALVIAMALINPIESGIRGALEKQAHHAQYPPSDGG